MYRRAILISALLLASAGCGGGDGADAKGEPSTPSASRSGVPPVASSGAPSSAVPSSAAPSSKRPLRAADGKRLRACAKGPCEVLVSPDDEIPTWPGARVAVLRVTEIGKNGVSYVAVAGGGATGSFTGQTPGTTSQINKLKITTVAVEGRRAVVRLGRP